MRRAPRTIVAFAGIVRNASKAISIQRRLPSAGFAATSASRMSWFTAAQISPSSPGSSPPLPSQPSTFE